MKVIRCFNEAGLMDGDLVYILMAALDLLKKREMGPGLNRFLKKSLTANESWFKETSD